jgi:hypothetical protein
MYVVLHFSVEITTQSEKGILIRDPNCYIVISDLVFG